MILIGISGKKRFGKDAACAIMQKVIKGSTFRIGFADAIKAEVAKEFNTSVRAIDLDKAKFRPILQQWGTLKREMVHSDYWIWKVRDSLLAQPPGLVAAIVPDVRRENEAQWIEDLGGFLVRVERPMSGTGIDDHITETALDFYDFKFTLSNNGTLDDFVQPVREFLKEVKKQLTPKHNVNL